MLFSILRLRCFETRELEICVHGADMVHVHRPEQVARGAFCIARGTVVGVTPAAEQNTHFALCLMNFVTIDFSELNVP